MELEQSLGGSLHTEADFLACPYSDLERALEPVGSHNPSPPQASHIHKPLLWESQPEGSCNTPI